MSDRPDTAPTESWWADDAFWDELFEFVFRGPARVDLRGTPLAAPGTRSLVTSGG